ncbi:MAG: sporulation protein YabP [Dethiobacter sp.]|nr:sporulation protein YabP [Dethiobacter sp.]MCL5981530.1 sporulation protein YabP [Bacillota bacterium]
MESLYSKQQGQHRLVINNREKVDITGVVHVDSFDDEEVVLETEQGLLAIRGEELRIAQLNLEKGELSLEGMVLETAYADDKRLRERGRGFLGRLFK